MLPGRRITSGRPQGAGLQLSYEGPRGPEQHDARFAVVAAGRRPAPLPFDEQLMEMVDADDWGAPVVQADYSLRWKGEDSHKIFVQNRARYVHGLQDSNLSLLAVRSATIINSLFGRTVYELADDCAGTVWD